MDPSKAETAENDNAEDEGSPQNSENGNSENNIRVNTSGSTDVSDIKIVGERDRKDSSDSIEVLNEGDGALGRRDTVIECTDDGSETTDGDTEHVDLDQLQLDDHTPAQETATQSYSTQYMSNEELADNDNSKCEPLDESSKDTHSKVHVLEKVHSHDQSGYASDSSFSRGGSIAGSDVEHLLGTDNLSDSSGYTDDHGPNQFSPFDSPIHCASNSDSQIANGSVINRPESLSLPRPLQFYERQRLTKKDSSSSISSYSSRSSSMDALIEAASTTPLHTQGKVTREGDMVAFVNDSLQEMIKRSSPLTSKVKKIVRFH